jgi:hypothetical protein
MVLPDGFYDGGKEFQVVRIKKAAGKIAGRVGISITSAKPMGYTWCAFLEADGSVRFFLRFEAANPPQRLEALRKVIAEIIKRHR